MEQHPTYAGRITTIFFFTHTQENFITQLFKDISIEVTYIKLG